MIIGKEKERKLRKLDDEIWKELPFTRGKYELSNYGRVRSYRMDKIKGRIMKLSDWKNLYQVCLPLKKGGRKTFFIHRLVAETFLTRPSAATSFVVHLDFNPRNNKVENLEWVTPDVANLRIAGYNSKRNLAHKVVTNSKLTKKDVKAIKTMLAKGVTQVMIAKMFCVSDMQVSRIKRGENWSDVTI